MRRIGIRTAEAGGFPRNVGPPGLGDLDEPTQWCQPGPVHRRRPLAMAVVPGVVLLLTACVGSGSAGRPQTSAPGLASDASTASPAWPRNRSGIEKRQGIVGPSLPSDG